MDFFAAELMPSQGLALGGDGNHPLRPPSIAQGEQPYPALPRQAHSGRLRGGSEGHRRISGAFSWVFPPSLHAAQPTPLGVAGLGSTHRPGLHPPALSWPPRPRDLTAGCS